MSAKVPYEMRWSHRAVCRVCGVEKDCCGTMTRRQRLESKGKRPEDVPGFIEGSVCHDCRREGAILYAREHGLSLVKNTAIHWFGKDGKRHEKLSNKKVNAGMPRFHQLNRELRPLAERMLEERIRHYTERHAHRPNIHATYLLVANVIRSIKSPNGPLNANFTHRKRFLKRLRKLVLFARQRGPRAVIPRDERVYTPQLEGI